jgi:hypothetical protein
VERITSGVWKRRLRMWYSIAKSNGHRGMNRFRFENLEIWKQAEGISQSNILEFVIKDESEDAWTLNNLTA